MSGNNFENGIERPQEEQVPSATAFAGNRLRVAGRCRLPFFRLKRGPDGLSAAASRETAPALAQSNPDG
jgi:hypothetical protein